LGGAAELALPSPDADAFATPPLTADPASLEAGAEVDWGMGGVEPFEGDLKAPKPGGLTIAPPLGERLADHRRPHRWLRTATRRNTT
jgi:hypothetical protein